MNIKYFKSFLIPGILFLFVFIIYMVSNKGEGSQWNYCILQADAFLHGRLNIINPPSWLNEVVLYKGNYYSVFPPMPAILLMPFVNIFGIGFYQPVLSWFLGAISVALSFLVFSKLFNRTVALWMSIVYGFGTIQWFHAEVGSAWYLAHIVALFFLWLILLELLTRKRFLVLGILVGGAYLSRLPTIFVTVFILFYLHEDFLIIKDRTLRVNWKNLGLLILGMMPFLLFNCLLNYLRYGVLEDIGYKLLPIFNEPWYKYGLINIRYIPIHLKEMFTSLPVFLKDPPFIIPSMFALAIWFTTPMIFFVFRANYRKGLVRSSLITILAISLPSLMHGGNGFTQFGYRHTLDYLPFILLLIADGLRGRVNNLAKLLIILSILVNFWGVIMISFLNKWEF